MHRNLFDICTMQSRMKIIGMVVDPLNAVAYIINRQPKNPPIVRIVIQSYTFRLLTLHRTIHCAMLNLSFTYANDFYAILHYITLVSWQYMTKLLIYWFLNILSDFYVILHYITLVSWQYMTKLLIYAWVLKHTESFDPKCML